MSVLVSTSRPRAQVGTVRHARNPVIQLRPEEHCQYPAYRIRAWRAGDPTRQVHPREMDLLSVVDLQTTKNIHDGTGTFRITFKDPAVYASDLGSGLRAMDVIEIALRGAASGWNTVLRGVVDTVERDESADATSASQDVVVEGRCLGKYLSCNALFLPVFDPSNTGVLPTSLVFGLGGAVNATKGIKPDPYDIYMYLLRGWVFGRRNMVGESGTPNARFWLRTDRFQKNLGITIPFLQLDEDDLMTAFKKLEITGITEAWVDELGQLVYRQPQWDAPYTYTLSTRDCRRIALTDSDMGLQTYVEVVPGANPNLAASTAQALLAGRAPVPSNYVSSISSAGANLAPDPSYVIHTDASGKVTSDGLKNHWYRLQRKYGVRPYQLTSPLLATQPQAQAQAEGLLRFFSRMIKSASIVIPGNPFVRIGTNLLLYGEVEGHRITRTFYIEGVTHEYTESQDYTTTLTLTHGRDPWDRAFTNVALPAATAADLAASGGVAVPGGSPGASTGASTGTVAWTNPDGSQVPVAGWIKPVLDYAVRHGWSGQVTSGWRSYTEQQHLYDLYMHGGNIAAKPGSSNHEFTDYPRGAIDTPDQAGMATAMASYPGAHKLVWFGPADSVHWSGNGK